MLTCSFHNDRTPSCVISPAKNLWHCLGACGQGGSVIDWIMKTDNLAFRDAVVLLAKRLPGADPLAAETKLAPKLTLITATEDD